MCKPFRAVTAAIRGTEFTVEVDPDGASTISLLQGDLAVFNNFGALDLAAGEMATARPGEVPRKQNRPRICRIAD